MHRAEVFVFESCRINSAERRVELTYSFDHDLFFTEHILLPESVPLDLADSDEVQRALFALHLIGGVSYYKAALPPRLQIRSGVLTPSQARAWDTIYTKGLGEFFYRNAIDFRGLVAFPAEAEESRANSVAVGGRPAASSWRRGLVPWGGGKDSAVTLELLRTTGAELTLFRLGAHHFIEASAARTGLNLLTLERRIDPALFALNKAGALNGHVPITTYMTFLTVLVCLLTGRDSVFFSSERSADFGNIEHHGMLVNHQWSKSLEAELLLRDYIASSITPAVDYVNPLRPLSELSIAELFSRHPEYFDVVTSCNTNWRILDSDPERLPWCGRCPKCAFVFAILSAFLPAQRLTGMFGKNLYDDPELLPLFRELWGGEGFKPFECVGTPEETRAALQLARRDPGYAGTVVMRAAATEVLPAADGGHDLITRALTPDWTGVPEPVRALLEGTLPKGDTAHADR